MRSANEYPYKRRIDTASYEVSQLKTKKAALEMALREYISMARRQDLASMFGQVDWDGDLNQMRTDTAVNGWEH